MTKVLDKDHKVFSLWARAEANWHHLATSNDISVLHLKAESLKKLFTTQHIIVIPGASAPTL